MVSDSSPTRTGCASVVAEGPAGPLDSPNDIQIRDVSIAIDAPDLRAIVVRHATAIVPATAYQRLVTTGASRAGVNARGSLGHGTLSVAVSVSLLRLTVTFEPMVRDGLLTLHPRSGIPGWLIGRAAPMVGRTAGVSMSSDGRVTVNLAAFVPSGVRLSNGLTSFIVTPEQIALTVG